MIDATVRIEIYQVDGKQTDADAFLTIAPHRDQNEGDNEALCVLTWSDQKIAIGYDELLAAVAATQLIAKAGA